MEMKNKILIITIILLSFSSFANAQRIKVILPGQTYNITSAKDTLWILTNTQLKKTIIAKRQLDISNKQIKEQKKIIDTLKSSNKEYTILVDTLKQDRDFYRNNWKKAEDDVTTLANMNNKCSKHLRIAIIVGGATTVVAFFAGIFAKL